MPPYQLPINTNDTVTLAPVKNNMNGTVSNISSS